MPFISKEEYRNIAKMQGLSNENNTVASTSGKNRKKGKAKGTAKASPATSVFSIEAAINAAIAEASHVKQQQQQADVPDASSTAMDKENAVPNENVVVDGFPLLGKRRSFVGTKTTTTSTMMAAMAMPWFAVATASATAGVAALDTGDDDEVEDINGVPDITENSLESLSPYSKSPCRPTSSGGSSDSSVAQQPTSAMKYSTMLSTTSLYNVMGTQSDATLTPRTLELSAVLDCLSFDFSSQNTTTDEVVPGDAIVSEDKLMQSKIDFSYLSINENITITTTFEVAQRVYGAVKDLWANGKHIPVICSLFDITEAVAAKVLDHITSSSVGVGTKEMVLLDIDERVIKPQMKMLDEKIVSPTITEVFKVIQLIVSKADELVIAPIIKGLIFFDRKDKDVVM